MIIVLMGVSGAGKTVAGRLLAGQLGWPFYDADDFHPPENVEKMRRADPLTDRDRIPWLEQMQELVRGLLKTGSSAVLACSALKSAYREYLLIDDRVRLVYLKGDYSLIQSRLSERRGHFMNPALLKSQFAALEEPEGAITVEVNGSEAEIVASIRSKLSV